MCERNLNNYLGIGGSCLNRLFDNQSMCRGKSKLELLVLVRVSLQTTVPVCQRQDVLAQRHIAAERAGP